MSLQRKEASKAKAGLFESLQIRLHRIAFIYSGFARACTIQERNKMLGYIVVFTLCVWIYLSKVAMFHNVVRLKSTKILFADMQCVNKLALPIYELP